MLARRIILLFLLMVPFSVSGMRRRRFAGHERRGLMLLVAPVMRDMSTQVRSQDFAQEQALECAVCLDDLSQSMSTRLLCGHVLHHTCLISCLAEKNTCPLCRGIISGSRLLASAENIERYKLKWAQIGQELKDIRVMKGLVDAVKAAGIDTVFAQVLEREKKLEQLMDELKKKEQVLESLQEEIEEVSKQVEERRAELDARIKQNNDRAVRMRQRQEELVEEVNRLARQLENYVRIRRR